MKAPMDIIKVVKFAGSEPDNLATERKNYPSFEVRYDRVCRTFRNLAPRLVMSHTPFFATLLTENDNEVTLETTEKILRRDSSLADRKSLKKYMENHPVGLRDLIEIAVKIEGLEEVILVTFPESRFSYSGLLDNLYHLKSSKKFHAYCSLFAERDGEMHEDAKKFFADHERSYREEKRKAAEMEQRKRGTA